MIAFLLRRAAHTLVVVTTVATLVFVLSHAAPGDPFAGSLDNPNVTEEVRARWRASYGLDQPLPAQYGRYLSRLARGDLGWSFSRQQPVAAVIREITRVGTAGYIEVPQAASAKILDFPSHLWWCRLDGSTLVFTAKHARAFDPEIASYIERSGVEN